MEIKIKNFQAIKDADLKFDVGITAIVGQTNSGKSSIVRAIEAAINNKAGNSFITYGADATEVTISTSTDSITWKKARKGSSTYIINGSELSKIGRVQNEEVASLLNMSEISINGDKLRLNFWKQLDYPFLVGKTSMQLFEFISQSKEQEIIETYQSDIFTKNKSLSKDIDSTNTKIDLRTKDLNQIKTQLTKLEKVNSYDISTLELMDTMYNSLKLLCNKETELKQIVVETNTNLQTKNNFLNKMSPILNSLKVNMDTYSIQSNLLNAYKDSKQTYDELTTKSNDNTDMINKLTPIGKKLEDIIKSMLDTENSARDIKLLLSQLETSQKSKTALENEITALDSKIKETTNELNKFEVCPMCGQDLKSHGGIKHE